MISVETKVTVRADLPSGDIVTVTEGAGMFEITQFHVNCEQTSLDIELGDVKAFIEALQTMAGSVSCEA